MHDDAFNLLYIEGGVVHPLHERIWPNGKISLRPVFMSKPHTRLAFAHAQMTQALQIKYFAFQNNSLVSQIRDMMRLWNFRKYVSLTKKNWLMKSFSFFVDIFKNLSLVCKLHSSHITQSVTLISSLHKGYPWHKFQSHAISGSWETSERVGVYPPPLTSYIIPCMLAIVAKRCIFK